MRALITKIKIWKGKVLFQDSHIKSAYSGYLDQAIGIMSNTKVPSSEYNSLYKVTHKGSDFNNVRLKFYHFLNLRFFAYTGVKIFYFISLSILALR